MDEHIHASLTPRYAFPPHRLAAAPVMTSAVAMPKALREYRAPLKLSSLTTRKGTSEDPRSRLAAFADAIPDVDVGGVWSVDDVAIRGGGGTTEGTTRNGARLIGGAEVD